MEYKRYYIAYGSNINLDQMAYRCPHAKVIGPQMLAGNELEFRGVATIVPKEDAQVPVLIWEIDQYDECSLDRYEGFPNCYRKEVFPIEVGGKTVEAMAYIMNHGQIEPPSQPYLRGILAGYEANGMDTTYLADAYKRSLSAQTHSRKVIFDDDEEFDINEDDLEEIDDLDDLNMELG